jgi:hypothetical protein
LYYRDESIKIKELGRQGRFSKAEEEDSEVKGGGFEDGGIIASDPHSTKVE